MTDNEKPSAETAPRTRTRRDGQATRAKILAAARAVIMEDGTDCLTIDRVIRRVGISKGAFLYHFHSRDALLEGLVDEYAEHLGEVQSGLEARESGAPHPMLASYLSWYREFHSGAIDQGASPLVALVMASKRNERFLAPVRAWYRDYFDRLAAGSRATEAGDEAQPENGCDGVDALLLTLAMDGLFFHQLFGIDVLTAEERATLIDRIELRSGNARPKKSGEKA